MVAGMVTAGTVSAHTPLEHVGYRYGFLQSRKAHRMPYACDHAHHRRLISYGLKMGHRPIRLPKYYEELV